MRNDALGAKPRLNEFQRSAQATLVRLPQHSHLRELASQFRRRLVGSIVRAIINDGNDHPAVENLSEVQNSQHLRT